MRAKKAFVEKTLIDSKNKNSLYKSDILNTFGAFSMITASIISGITIIAAAAITNVGLVPTSFIMGGALASGGYIAAGYVFGKKVEKFRKNAAIAAVILTSATLTPISASAINNKDFQNGLTRDLTRMEKDLKLIFNKSASNAYYSSKDNTISAAPEINKTATNTYALKNSY